MRHHPEHSTTCDVSDLLNEITRFVEENPEWHESADMCARMTLAMTVLRISCPDPAMCTDDEYEFVMDICKTLNSIKP